MDAMIGRRGHLLAAAVLLAAALSAEPAAANLPLGACCFANGSCQDLMATQCDFQNGDFIGEGTACANIDCDGPVAAPVMSIFGFVAVLGALAALGAYRLARRRVP